MSTDSEIRRLEEGLAALPGLHGRTISTERMADFGEPAATVLITVAGHPHRYVARVRPEGHGVPESEARREAAATRWASEAGLGPPVLVVLDDGAYVVTRYVEGSRVLQLPATEPDLMRRVGRAFKRLHAAAAIPARLEILEAAAAYVRQAQRGGVAPPSTYARAEAIIRRMAAAGLPQTGSSSPCHNDPFSNMIDDGSRIWLVDWEFAGMGDPFFDLGSISAKFRLSPAQDAILLEAYDEVAPEPVRLTRLRLMRIVADFHEAAWHVREELVRRDGVQLTKADEHLDDLLAAAGGPAFEEALAFVSGGPAPEGAAA